MRMKKALAELVHRERVSRVATANEAGMPHLVPVCHVVDEGRSTSPPAPTAERC